MFVPDAHTSELRLALFRRIVSAPVSRQELFYFLRKDLRGKVRRIVHPAGLQDWKEIPSRVEEFALKSYIKT